MSNTNIDDNIFNKSQIDMKCFAHLHRIYSSFSGSVAKEVAVVPLFGNNGIHFRIAFEYRIGRKLNFLSDFLSQIILSFFYVSNVESITDSTGKQSID